MQCSHVLLCFLLLSKLTMELKFWFTSCLKKCVLGHLYLSTHMTELHQGFWILSGETPSTSLFLSMSGQGNTKNEESKWQQIGKSKFAITLRTFFKYKRSEKQRYSFHKVINVKCYFCVSNLAFKVQKFGQEQQYSG